MTGVKTLTRAAPLLLGLAMVLLLLGPALAPGLVLSYDLAWSPVPRWTPFVLGVDVPAPRAVPSDAVAVALGTLVTPAIAQKLVLVLVLVLAATGVAALLRHLRPDLPVAAGLAAVIGALWNPFVGERLVVGHWTVLLGYAVLPWLWRAVLCVRAGGSSVRSVAGWLALASAGGANSLVIALFGVAALFATGVPWRARVAGVLVWLGSAAAWALPALAGPTTRVEAGVAEFSPEADTPMGAVVSLLSGGGFWNSATHPPERSGWAVALLATALAVAAAGAAGWQLWRRGARPLLVMAALSLLVCTVSAVAGMSGLWSALVMGIPGGGLLRDSHKLLAPWVVLLALGMGLVVGVLVERSRLHSWTGPAAAVLIAVPVLLLPSLFWGMSGRLQTVEVPADYLAVADTASQLPPGEMGLLPWNQYRRYAWNSSRVSLTLAPRLIDHRFLFDDSLPLAQGTVAGEDPRAERVSRRIAQGADPIDALVSEGVDYVAIELDTGIPVSVPGGVGQIVAESDHLAIVQVGQVDETRRTPAGGNAWLGVGWTVTVLTWSAVSLGVASSRLRRSYRPV